MCEQRLLSPSVCLSVSLSPSHRSLDLTGPLFLGGVPNVPDNFPFGTREFTGCMKDLHIDNKPVDMAGYVANNGTLPGVCAHIATNDYQIKHKYLMSSLLSLM